MAKKSAPKTPGLASKKSVTATPKGSSTEKKPGPGATHEQHDEERRKLV